MSSTVLLYSTVVHYSKLFRHFPFPISLFQSFLFVRSLPCFHQTFHRANSSSSPNTSFLPSTPFNRHWLLFWRSEIFSMLSTNNWPSKVSWLSVGSLHYHSFISTWQTCSCIIKLYKHKSKSNPWFTPTLRTFRSTVRCADNLWKQTHSLCSSQVFFQISS